MIKNRREILEWLYSGSFDSRHVSLQETRSQNCGQWFVKSKEFTQWIEATGPPCLLCAGIRISTFNSFDNDISWSRKIDAAVTSIHSRHTYVLVQLQ